MEKNGYLVRPAPGAPQSVHCSTYWLPSGPKKIEIVFTTGTSGLEMQLTVQGQTLQGIRSSGQQKGREEDALPRPALAVASP